MNRLEKDVYAALRGRGGGMVSDIVLCDLVFQQRTERYWGMNAILRLFAPIPSRPTSLEIEEAAARLGRSHRVRRWKRGRGRLRVVSTTDIAVI